MEMQVMDALASLFTNIGDNSIAVQTELFSDFRDHSEDMSHNSSIVFGHFGYGSDMGFGDDQKMSGSLGINVIECETNFVFIDLVRRDLTLGDLTEQTIGPRNSSLYV